jgi:arsenate reductase (glutaredoxin)
MLVTVYQYPKCSTCRNALKWLAERGIDVKAVDIVASPPPASGIGRLHRRSGLPLAKFFNTSGERYRGGNFKEKLKTMSDADVYAALASDGKLIKRPLVDAGETVLVGFDPATWASALERR